MQIIGVRFRQAGKIYFFEPTDEEIVAGDSVLVETEQGLECVKVVIGKRELRPDESAELDFGVPLKKIYRKATEQDLLQQEENLSDEKLAFRICRDKIREHQLPMKLINVKFTFEMNKIVFFFTADSRVDFRDLVKDLANIFRTRIELRQVGVRDQAKCLGGMGGCGRPLCCASFLGDFVPVSIRMAKDQNLSLNPTKISGVCGRLMCCLKFENDLYCGSCPKQNVILKPKQGSRVIVSDGEGRVVALNIQRRNATILLDSNKTVVVGWEEILPVNDDDFETVEGSAQMEEVTAIEVPPPKSERPQRSFRQERSQRQDRSQRPPRQERSSRQERPQRSERSRRTDSSNRRYNQTSERRQDRQSKPRGERSRRQSDRNSRRK